MIRHSPAATMRNQSLDVLRFIAVFMVLCCHYHVWWPMQAGYVGVDLFFVLSGFLISGLLYSDIQKFGKVRYGRFILRRGFKIYPPFYCFLLITWLCFPWIRPHLKVEAVFLQNYYLIPMPIGSLWAHLWSLAVEEHFYLALPIILIVLARFKLLRPSVIVGLWLTLAVGCAVWRIPYYNRTGMTPTATHLRCDALFAGVTLGYFYHFRREWFEQHSRTWMLLVGLLLTAPAFADHANAAVMSLTFTSVSVGFALILWWAIPRNIPFTSHIAEIGAYSYSIYLWQMPVSMFWHSRAESLLGFVGFVITSLAIGVAMSLIIEQPALALRERLTKQKAPPVKGEAPALISPYSCFQSVDRL